MTKRKRMGRPRSAMTPEVEAAILRAVGEGLPFSMAARCAGVSRDTAVAHRQRHADFATAVEKAEGTSVNYYAQKIREAARKTWQAAAWMLERRWPDDWALRKPAAERAADAAEIARMVRKALAEADDIDGTTA